MKKGLWLLVKFAYKTLLRGLVEKAVLSTDTEWDDKILIMLDALFEYEE